MNRLVVSFGESKMSAGMRETLFKRWTRDSVFSTTEVLPKWFDAESVSWADDLMRVNVRGYEIDDREVETELVLSAANQRVRYL